MANVRSRQPVARVAAARAAAQVAAQAAVLVTDLRMAVDLAVTDLAGMVPRLVATSMRAVMLPPSVSGSSEASCRLS